MSRDGEGEYWTDQACGCRYQITYSIYKTMSRWSSEKIERCEEHRLQHLYIKYLCATPLRRQRMEKRLDAKAVKYIKRRYREGQRSAS